MIQVEVELFNFIICYCMYWHSIEFTNGRLCSLLERGGVTFLSRGITVSPMLVIYFDERAPISYQEGGGSVW